MTQAAAPVVNGSPLSAAVFWAFGALAVGGGLWTILSRSPIRAALGLLFNILAIAVLFVLLQAHLLAALQVLVYAGAIVVLFVFVIMLLGPSAAPPPERHATFSRVIGVVLVAFVSYRTVPLLWAARIAGEPPPAPDAGFGTVEALGGVLFGPYTFLFEAVGVLLLIALLGAIAVARGRQPEAK